MTEPKPPTYREGQRLTLADVYGDPQGASDVDSVELAARDAYRRTAFANNQRLAGQPLDKVYAEVLPAMVAAAVRAFHELPAAPDGE